MMFQKEATAPSDLRSLLVLHDKLCPLDRMAFNLAADCTQQLTFMTLPSQFPLTFPTFDMQL